jgi:DNA-binding response OmpR family regulator
MNPKEGEPMNSTALAETFEAPQAQPKKEALGRGRVLIIEPDSPTLEQLARSLRDKGLEVTGVYDAEDMIHTMSNPDALDPRPDVIITEADKWGDPGLNVLVWLKAAHTDIPVIVLFDQVDFVMMGEADALGANCVFCRPCEIDELTLAALSALPS